MLSNDKKRWRMASNLVLTLMSLAAILPFILLVIAAFTDETAALLNGYSYVPQSWSLDAYRYVIEEAGTLLRAYGVTIIVTVTGVCACLFLTALMGYGLSKEGLPGRKILNFIVIFTMLFSGGLVPQYLIYTNVFHIKDTLWALIVPNLMLNAFQIILVKNYFQFSLPAEMFEAARIDGAGELKILIRVALPLSKPILATIGMMTTIAYWNDWQNGMYYLNNTRLYSIQNILNAINTSVQFLATNSVSGVDITALPTTTIRMAIAVVGILPLIIAYPFFQKYFIQGITMGAVKG